MLKRAIYHILWMGKNINIALYIYVNYFCKSVKRAMIMKGSNIGTGSIIGANAYIAGNVPANTLVSCIPSRTVLKDVKWARDMSSEAVENARMYVNGKVD